MTDFRAKGTIMGPTGLTAVFGMGTGVTPPLSPPEIGQVGDPENCRARESEQRPRRAIAAPSAPWFPSGAPRGWSSPRLISTGALHVLPRFHGQPIDVVLFHEPYLVIPVGGLILGRASRLDAFSAYPCPT